MQAGLRPVGPVAPKWAGVLLGGRASPKTAKQIKPNRLFSKKRRPGQS